MKLEKVEIDEVRFAEAVAGMKAMTMDRAAAAAHAGLKLTTFQTQLRRRGLLQDLKGVRRSAGALSPHAEKDPEKIAAYAAAIDEAIRTNNILGTAKKYPLVDPQVLGRKVRKARADRAAAPAGLHETSAA